MKLPSNVKIKSFLWNVSPILSKYTANAIYPNIYLPKAFYEELKTKNPDPKKVAILIHEQTHIKRQREMGWFIWGLKNMYFCQGLDFKKNLSQ